MYISILIQVYFIPIVCTAAAKEGVPERRARRIEPGNKTILSTYIRRESITPSRSAITCDEDIVVCVHFHTITVVRSTPTKEGIPYQCSIWIQFNDVSIDTTGISAQRASPGGIAATRGINIIA